MSDLEAKAGAALSWAPHIIPIPAEQTAGCDLWGAGAGRKSKKKKRDETPEERKARKKAKKAKKRE